MGEVLGHAEVTPVEIDKNDRGLFGAFGLGGKSDKSQEKPKPRRKATNVKLSDMDLPGLFGTLDKITSAIGVPRGTWEMKGKRAASLDKLAEAVDATDWGRSLAKHGQGALILGLAIAVFGPPLVTTIRSLISGAQKKGDKDDVRPAGDRGPDHRENRPGVSGGSPQVVSSSIGTSAPAPWE